MFETSIENWEHLLSAPYANSYNTELGSAPNQEFLALIQYHTVLELEIRGPHLCFFGLGYD